MNWIKKFKYPLLVIALTASIGANLAFGPSYFEVSKNLDIFSTLFKELNTYYVDEIESSKLMRDGIDAMLEGLDPYTTYISESEIENYRLQTTGKYGGIGAVIRKLGDHVVVAEPYKDFPADKAGLKAGDRILTVAGKDVKGKSTGEVSKILKGQPGTKVDIEYERMQQGGEWTKNTVALDREEIQIKNVPFYGMVEDKYAYIRLAHFTQKAGKEVRDALTELKASGKVEGIILDLRGNPGGLLNEAVNVSNVFIPKGQEVVSTKGKIDEWDKTFKTLNNPVELDLPIAVLTNRGSASASEIVSGSIQDLDRGVVIGQKTFGKGLVQTTRSLSYNTKLKVTTAKYYIPSGRCIQAINYADKDEEGKANKLPDSLKTAFKTAGGRTVYDGGGIDPDIDLDPNKISNIARALIRENVIFDYATQYVAQHPSIAGPRDFILTEAEYNEFKAFVNERGLDYETTTEKRLEALKEVAEKEEYLEAIKDDIETLEKELMADKNNDLTKQKDEVKEILELELVNRYYYEAGRIEASFKYDNEIVEAVSVLGEPKQYASILGK